MRKVEGRRSEAREPMAEYYRRLLCGVFRRNDLRMHRICTLQVASGDRNEVEYINATDHTATVTVENMYLMKFLSRGMRLMMNIRYPRFTIIELGVLVVSIIIAAAIQM
jgi:hypothetical protein